MSGGKTNDQEHKETVAGADPADGAATPAETSKPATGSSPLEADNADLKDRLLRALAECENVRRRGERLASDARRSAIAEFAREVLTVADNLHRAIEAATLAPTKPTAEASVIEGVRATERTLAKALEKFGIHRIRALGVAFDPHLHEAVQQLQDDEHPPGTIVEVIEDGYMLDDRLLRPTRAIVAGPKLQEQHLQEAQG